MSVRTLADSGDFQFQRQDSDRSSLFYRSKGGSGFLSSNNRLEEAMKHLGFDIGSRTEDTMERIKMTEREGASVIRDTFAFAIAAQLQVETNLNRNLPKSQSSFEYFTFVIAEGSENDTTSILQIGDAINFIKVQREHMNKSKSSTWLVSLKPIVDPSQHEVSAPLNATSIQREMVFMSTGYEHEGMFFDIKVNQISKIFDNFKEKIYEQDKGSSLMHPSGMRIDTTSSATSQSISTGKSHSIHKNRKVITLVLDFSICITEIGASQLKMAVNDFIK